jgi:hypothetical protein
MLEELENSIQHAMHEADYPRSVDDMHKRPGAPLPVVEKTPT